MSKRTFVLYSSLLILLVALLSLMAIGPKLLHKFANMSPPGMATAKLGLGSFPDIDQSGLSQTQRAIIAVAKAEHAAQPAYTKYSEGSKEPWCADFASWVMKEAGTPYINPNSGQWRIPGTLTLKEYYQSDGRFKPLDNGYQPTVGDVVLYDGRGWFGQHTNIVLKNEDGKITTVGGNEAGKIRVQTREIGTEGTVGYGTLTKL